MLDGSEVYKAGIAIVVAPVGWVCWLMSEN